jgi:hypothetical protein
MSLLKASGHTVAELSLYKELTASSRSLIEEPAGFLILILSDGLAVPETQKRRTLRFECGASHILFIGLPN